MAKVSIVTPDKARRLESGALEYLGGDAPLHLQARRLGSGLSLTLEAAPVERLIYVQDGAVEVGGTGLPQGSVVIVERGAAAVVRGGSDESALLLFNGAAPPANAKAGGHVHLLPRERVPVAEALGASGVGGALFADAQCPTCDVWLHENRFPAPSGPRLDPEAGIHSHEEDEIIFITGGQMQLGRKLVGPGTAIAIAANTFYSFLPGPDGLTFINFRAGLPRDIHFADGTTADEVAIWSRVDRPLEYLAPAV